MTGEVVELRRRLADLEAELDRLESVDLAANRSVVGVLTNLGSYPVGSGPLRVFAVVPQDITGAETEGGSVAQAPRSGYFLAVGLSATIPPAGTSVVCTEVDGVWVFS